MARSDYRSSPLGCCRGRAPRSRLPVGCRSHGQPGGEGKSMRPAAAPTRDLDPELEVLQGICHAFGSADDLSEASASAVRWIHAALGPAASVRISLANGGGRLKTVAESGLSAEAGRKS